MKSMLAIIVVVSVVLIVVAIRITELGNDNGVTDYSKHILEHKTQKAEVVPESKIQWAESIPAPAEMMYQPSTANEWHITEATKIPVCFEQKDAATICKTPAEWLRLAQGCVAIVDRGKVKYQLTILSDSTTVEVR